MDKRLIAMMIMRWILSTPQPTMDIIIMLYRTGKSSPISKDYCHNLQFKNRNKLLSQDKAVKGRAVVTKTATESIAPTVLGATTKIMLMILLETRTGTAISALASAFALDA